MVSSEIFASVALSTLGVSAQTTFATSTVPSSVPTSSPALDARAVNQWATCSAADSPRSDLTCGVVGSIKNDASAWDNSIAKDSVEACAEYCYTQSGCESFYYDEGWCQLFGDFYYMQFTAEEGGKTFYEKECFDCKNDAGVLVKVDFSYADTDAEIAKWGMYADTDDTCFMDIQLFYAPQGGTRYGLRVGEIATEGKCTAQYLPRFILKAGATYKLGIKARSAKMQEAGLGDDFSNLSIYVYNSNEVIYQVTPGKGESLGGDWYYWQWGFTPTAGQAGRTTIGIEVQTSGKELDWWFTDLLVERMV
ncbi:Fc.00g058530.m01.CDS01 [Cosmosporella sp. VM-42]